jgi:hypothetical protein
VATPCPPAMPGRWDGRPELPTWCPIVEQTLLDCKMAKKTSLWKGSMLESMLWRTCFYPPCKQHMVLHMRASPPRCPPIGQPSQCFPAPMPAHRAARAASGLASTELSCPGGWGGGGARAFALATELQQTLLSAVTRAHWCVSRWGAPACQPARAMPARLVSPLWHIMQSAVKCVTGH